MEPLMSQNDRLIQIRTRKLGILIKDARIAAHQTVQELAQAIGISPEKMQEYEDGITPPSLPELETLAYQLNIPLEHFWSRQSMSEAQESTNLKQVQQLNMIRQRMIGTQLKVLRNKNNVSVHDLSEITGIPESVLKQYESGEIPIPIPHLEIIAGSLNIRMEDFFDQRGPIGNWRAQQQAIKQFMELPRDLQDFVGRPVNLPYLTLAMRLSELSVDKLRGVAEGLLEITY